MRASSVFLTAIVLSSVLFLPTGLPALAEDDPVPKTMDLTVRATREKDSAEMQGRVGDVLDPRQLKRIVLLENRTSAPADVKLFTALIALVHNPEFERPPEEWRPWPPHPSCRVAIVRDGNEIYQLTIWRDWARLTSAKRHGYFRMPTRDQVVRLARERGDQLRRLVDRRGGDLFHGPNRDENRRWRKASESEIFDQEEIQSVALCRSTTSASTEEDLQRVLELIVDGQPFDPVKKWPREFEGKDPPVIAAFVQTRSGSVFSVVVRGEAMRLTSEEGCGYFTARQIERDAARKPVFPIPERKVDVEISKATLTERGFAPTGSARDVLVKTISVREFRETFGLSIGALAPVPNASEGCPGLCHAIAIAPGGSRWKILAEQAPPSAYPDRAAPETPGDLRSFYAQEATDRSLYLVKVIQW